MSDAPFPPGRYASIDGGALNHYCDNGWQLVEVLHRQNGGLFLVYLDESADAARKRAERDKDLRHVEDLIRSKWGEFHELRRLVEDGLAALQCAKQQPGKTKMASKKRRQPKVKAR